MFPQHPPVSTSSSSTYPNPNQQQFGFNSMAGAPASTSSSSMYPNPNQQQSGFNSMAGAPASTSSSSMYPNPNQQQSGFNWMAGAPASTSSSSMYPNPNQQQQGNYLTSSEERMVKFRQIVGQYEINQDFAMRLRNLEGFEVVFICDDSGSMGTAIGNITSAFDRRPTRWDELKQTVS
ncbi:unnamed protein product, partial [Didymodactylos carnosus]